MSDAVVAERALGIEGQRFRGDEARKQNVSGPWCGCALSECWRDRFFPLAHEKCTAAIAIANVIKSSLGPVGLDKMIVSASGEVMVTNDGATILQQLMVEHPAGKVRRWLKRGHWLTSLSAQVLVDLARLQDQEVGDGTTSVVILAAELLRRAAVLVEHDVHPQTVIGGWVANSSFAILFCT
jgi:hypothetical protein